MIENIRMNDGTMGEAEVIKEATTVSMFPLFPPDDSLVLLRLQLQLWKLYLRSVYLVNKVTYSHDSTPGDFFLKCFNGNVVKKYCLMAVKLFFYF